MIKQTVFSICICVMSVLPLVSKAAPTLVPKQISQTGNTILPVPHYVQQHTNSCEASSLRMALAYYGITERRDLDIIKRFGYKPVLKDTVNNIWSDPQKQFVGFADSTGRGQGYGVYGLPVAEAILDYGLKADYYQGVSSSTAQTIAEEIRLGNPVMVWGYSSITEEPYTWKTPEGKEVRAFRGEHVRLIVGVSGPTSAPTGFYIHDSLTKEKNKFWKTSDLIKNMSAVPGVTDQFIVIR